MVSVSEVKNALVDQKNINLSGNLYYRTQIDFAYNTNHIEGSTITKDETVSIYDTGTILTTGEKSIVLKDVSETQNHFTLFKHMLNTLDQPLTEQLIKEFHQILKNGTYTDEELKTYNIGEYKKLPNEVGETKTTLPKDVPNEMKQLMDWYNNIKVKTLDEIIQYHYRFEKIHPFQDGNGRVGRIIMFRECLNNDVMPFIIEDRNKSFYIRGLKEYDKEKGYLTDTCLSSQDNYKKLVEYFLSKNISD